MFNNAYKMKRNTYYILVGLIALAEVAIFWLSVDTRNPLLMVVAFVVGVLLIYLAKRRVKEIIEDERTILINQKAALRTLEVFWVLFFALSFGAVVIGLSGRLPYGEPNEPPILPHPEFRHFGLFGIAQMALLCLMIFLYVGFRIYYAQKYGEWEKDEE